MRGFRSAPMYYTVLASTIRRYFPKIEIKVFQGDHRRKTENPKVPFSRQGKHKEFAKRY